MAHEEGGKRVGEELEGGGVLYIRKLPVSVEKGGTLRGGGGCEWSIKFV